MHISDFICNDSEKCVVLARALCHAGANLITNYIDYFILYCLWDVYEAFLGPLFKCVCNKESFEAMSWRIAKKFPLFDTVKESSEKVSRWPRGMIFYLPHSRTVSTIDLSIWMLFSYWLWFEAEIMTGTVCSGLFKQPLNSDPVIIASLWYYSFSWLVKIPPFPVAFPKFVKGVATRTPGFVLALLSFAKNKTQYLQ